MDVSILKLVGAVCVGAVLGLWFFGGLMWTVRRLPGSRHPLRLMLASFAVRTGLVAAALVWMVGFHWLLPLAAMAGFAAVRVAMLKTLGNPPLESTTE